MLSSRISAVDELVVLPTGRAGHLLRGQILSAAMGASPSVRPQAGVEQALQCRSRTHAQLSLVLCKDANDYVGSNLK